MRVGTFTTKKVARTNRPQYCWHTWIFSQNKILRNVTIGQKILKFHHKLSVRIKCEDRVLEDMYIEK